MSGEAVSQMKAVIKDPKHSTRIANELQTFNVRKSYTDLCFVCARGSKVYANKLVLCAVSTHIKDILLELPDHLQEVTIHVPDIDFRVMTYLVDFLVEGSVKVNQSEHTHLQETMKLLGVVLTTPSTDYGSKSVSQPHSQPAPPAALPQVPTHVQPQAPQLVYIAAPPNSQGQVPYVLAQPQMIQGTVVQSSMAQQATTQPIIMTQASGQMVPAGSQVVQPQVQPQTNMIQMVQQNNGQVVPMNNQIMAGNQIVNSAQMVQCSSQMVVQGNQQAMMNNNQQAMINNNQQAMMNNNQQAIINNNQQTMINNNQMQVGMQNQVIQSNFVPNQTVQQRPQYVMSNNNQLTTSRAPRQYTQTQNTGQSNIQRGAIRGRATQLQQQQANRIANDTVSSEGDMILQEVVNIVEESGDVWGLTVASLRQRLEQRLNKDLSHQVENIEIVLKSFLSSMVSRDDGASEVITGDVASVSASAVNTSNLSPKSKLRSQVKRGKPIPFTHSDDEKDEDFIVPRKRAKRGRRKKN